MTDAAFASLERAWLDPKSEPEVIGECCMCNDEIYDYEDYYEPDGEFVCGNCPTAYMKEHYGKVGIYV